MTMPTETQRFVSYLRVSTQRQGKSGLGLEAQRHTVNQFIARHAQSMLLQEYVEIESGKNNDRPKLMEAMSRAENTGATLVIAKLDRLSRNAHFLTGLAERKVRFVACDMPDANEFTITIMAALAQQERKMISERTRAALQAAKANGKKLGNPNGAIHLKGFGNAASVQKQKETAMARASQLRTEIAAIKQSGHITLSAIASALQTRFIQTPRGGQWSATTVSRLLKRLDLSL